VIARGIPHDWSFGNVDDNRHRSTERLSAELDSTFGSHVSSRFYVMADHVRRIDVGGTNDAINNIGGGSINPYTGNYEPGVTWATGPVAADGTVTPTSTVVPVNDPSLWYFSHNVTKVDLEYTEAHLKNDYAAKFESSWFKSTTLAGYAADFSKVHYKSYASSSRPSLADAPNGATINGVAYPGLSGITYPPYQFPAIVPANFSLATPTSSQVGGDVTSKQGTLQGFFLETLSVLNDRIQLSGGLSRFYGYLDRTDTTNTSLNSTILLAAPSYNLQTNAKTVGIVVKPIKEVSLFASRNTTGGTMPGELSPGTYLENTTTFGPDAYHASATTVQAFRPTSGGQDEFGAKTSLLGGAFTASVAYFKISQRNYPVPNSDYYTLVAQGNQAAANALPNPIYLDLNAKGWEFESTYSFNKNLTILGNYTSMKERQPITDVRVRACPTSRRRLPRLSLHRRRVEEFRRQCGRRLQERCRGRECLGLNDEQPDQDRHWASHRLRSETAVVPRGRSHDRESRVQLSPAFVDGPSDDHQPDGQGLHPGRGQPHFGDRGRSPGVEDVLHLPVLIGS
jgi:iron complex outermembrane receptor protein